MKCESSSHTFIPISAQNITMIVPGVLPHNTSSTLPEIRTMNFTWSSMAAAKSNRIRRSYLNRCVRTLFITTIGEGMSAPIAWLRRMCRVISCCSWALHVGRGNRAGWTGLLGSMKTMDLRCTGTSAFTHRHCTSERRVIGRHRRSSIPTRYQWTMDSDTNGNMAVKASHAIA